MGWRPRAAMAVGALVGVMLVGGALLLVEYPESALATAAFAGYGSLGALTATLGVVIARRIPTNQVGLLLTVVGGLVVFFITEHVYYATAVRHPGSVPLDSRVVSVLDESGWWLIAAVALLLLHFPDGRLPGPRWRTAPWLLVAVTSIVQGLGSVSSDPFVGPVSHWRRPWVAPAWVQSISLLGFFVMVALLVASGISLVIRYRRAGALQRAQIKWLSSAGLVVVLYPLVCLADVTVTGRAGVVSTTFGLIGMTSLPLSIAVAMLRHDLYDVDRVIAVSATYLLLSALLLGVYGAVAVVVGTVTGGESAVGAAVATGVCALALAPTRRRVQAAVDRRLYPPRRAAQLAVADLQRRIHEANAEPEQLEMALRHALHDDGLRVGLLLPGTRRYIDAAGRVVDAEDGVPVMLGDEPIGVLTTTGATSPSVLSAVAATTASLVEVIRLRAELARALRDVQDSRSRLVAAEYTERRRLERDLHDGAQQRLVSLGMQLRVAQRHLRDDQFDLDTLIDLSVAELGTAVAELRQIAHGLRPSALDDGLEVALAAVTASLPVPVGLDIDSGALPSDLATTVYYVAAEAITNAAKHAQPSRIDVRVARADHRVRVCVTDDGRGGAVVRPGSGLAGLADRLEAVAGTLSIRSGAGIGTVVEAELPCGS